MSQTQFVQSYSFKHFEPIADLALLSQLIAHPEDKALLCVEHKSNTDLLGVILSKYDILNKDAATFDEDLALIGEHFDILVAPREKGYSSPPMVLVVDSVDIAAKNPGTLQRFEQGMEGLSGRTKFTRTDYPHKDDMLLTHHRLD